MQFKESKLRDAWLIDLEPARDNRGYFMRTFCVQEFAAHGLETSFLQQSVSFTAIAGSVRGMHFQREPYGEVKLVRCANGAIWDVIIDIRPESSTFGQWQGFELSDQNARQLYIPRGFAHGFQTLRQNVQVNYLISQLYAPKAARGVRYDDPRFGITWPLPVTMISEKDLLWPRFATGVVCDQDDAGDIVSAPEYRTKADSEI
jgi:dTDP-4-dehydrorhamnose 3,5-epimerase